MSCKLSRDDDSAVFKGNVTNRRMWWLNTGGDTEQLLMEKRSDFIFHCLCCFQRNEFSVVWEKAIKHHYYLWVTVTLSLAAEPGLKLFFFNKIYCKFLWIRALCNINPVCGRLWSKAHQTGALLLLDYFLKWTS